MQKVFVRPDGSVNHIVEFNPETGEFVCSYGGQGWGVYGFMISYIHTGKQEYLDTAKRIAHYIMANIPDDGIIPVDFRQPKEPAWEDSCDACVIENGLIEIAKHVPELEKDMYLKAAVKIQHIFHRPQTGPFLDNSGFFLHFLYFSIKKSEIKTRQKVQESFYQ